MILIKGMDMPESCYYCPFASGSWGYGHEKWCDALGKQIPDGGTLMNWCPLTEIPPHGRLIDANALMNNKSIIHFTDDYYEEPYIFIDDIYDAPTIIEEE